MASQIFLHLENVIIFAAEKFLGQLTNPLITSVVAVLVFQPLDYAPGIALDHHGGNF